MVQSRNLVSVRLLDAIGVDFARRYIVTEDPRVKLASFAPAIRGAILDSIRALDWVPRLIRNKAHQYERGVRDLAHPTLLRSIAVQSYGACNSAHRILCHRNAGVVADS